MKNTEVVKNKIVTYLQGQDENGKTYEEMYDFVNEKETLCSANTLYDTVYELLKTEQITKDSFGSFYAVLPVHDAQIDQKKKMMIEKWVYSYLTKPINPELTFEEIYNGVKDLMQKNEALEENFDMTSIVHVILQDLVNKHVLQKTKQEDDTITYFIRQETTTKNTPYFVSREEIRNSIIQTYAKSENKLHVRHIYEDLLSTFHHDRESKVPLFTDVFPVLKELENESAIVVHEPIQQIENWIMTYKVSTLEDLPSCFHLNSVPVISEYASYEKEIVLKFLKENKKIFAFEIHFYDEDKKIN